MIDGKRGIGLACVACMAFAGSLGAQPAGLGAAPPAWRFLPSAGIAYDTFGQRYVVADDDTLDLLDEVSGRVLTTLERRGRTAFRLRNSLSIGQEATRDELQLTLSRTGAPLEVRCEQELHLKKYAPGTEYTLSSDYLASTTRLTAAWRFARGWRLLGRERFEGVDFASRTRYTYDHWMNDTGATLERTYGFFSRLAAGYAYGMRAVPDSTAIDYRRHVATAEWQHDVGAHGVAFDERVERRSYGDPWVRSASWDLNGGLAGHLALHPRLRLRSEYRADVRRYDTSDSIYANATEQSAELLLEGDASENATIAVGPRAQFRRTASPLDRPYNQWGVKGSVTFGLGTRLWLQFTDEVGARSHLAGDDLLLSDFVYNWSSLYLTWEPARRLLLDVYFSLDPESHDDATDDTTTILLSASMTYGWR